MSGTWQRTFEIAVPLDDVWEAFTDPEYRAKLFAPPFGEEAEQHDPQQGLRMLEVDPKRKLRWAQEREDLPEKAEFTVVFEESERGSRISVTRAGFGEGEVADVFSKSNGLGWEHGFMDFVLALETGQIAKRHYAGAGKCGMGMVVSDENDWGLEVLQVVPGGFAAEAGLARGDRLVRIGDVPIFSRAELWALNAVHDPGTALDVEYVRGRELRAGHGRTSPIAGRAVGE